VWAGVYPTILHIIIYLSPVYRGFKNEYLPNQILYFKLVGRPMGRNVTQLGNNMERGNFKFQSSIICCVGNNFNVRKIHDTEIRIL